MFFFDECEGISRFGINNHNTQEIAQSFNGALFSIIKINEDNIKPSGNKLLNTNDKGGKSQSNKSNDQAVLNYDNFKMLHPLETLLFKEAVGFMLSKKTKSILIDIFERDKWGYVDICDKNKVKTHTVVLCRENIFENNNFLVIDPSNSEFSKHFGLLGVNNIFSMELEKEINIFVSPVNYKIYEQNKEIGTECAFNKFRDCIDIAFKLAKKFNLLKDQKISFNINEKENNVFNEKEANLIIKAITNNKVFDTDIEPFLHKQGFLKYPLRGKQLNDDLRKEDFYKKQINLHKTINNILNDIKDERIGELLQKVIIDCFNSQDNILDFSTKLTKTYKNYQISQKEVYNIWDSNHNNSVENSYLAELDNLDKAVIALGESGIFEYYE